MVRNGNRTGNEKLGMERKRQETETGQGMETVRNGNWAWNKKDRDRKQGQTMTMKKEIKFLRENFIFYLTGLLVILGLKCYYRQADCDSLLWILAPTARWVELLSKIPFIYIPGTGYVNHSLRMVIAPSCSGVRFMVITFAMLTFSFVHMVATQRLHAKARGLGWIAASAFLSWLFTVFVNGLRIIIAIYLPMYLEEAGLMRGMLTQDRLHTMIGVAVYFASLLAIYRLISWCIQNRTRRRPALALQGNKADQQDQAVEEPGIHRNQSAMIFIKKCASPVFWYFALTLGIPFLSRIYKGGTAEFTEFAVLVAGCCTLILLPYVMILFLHRQK